MTESAVALLNRYFARGLGGIPIVGRSRWRHFRLTNCAHAATDNVALVGDAFVTVFYETGWGTSSALQGARTLRQALRARSNVAEALSLYAGKAPEIWHDLVATSARAIQEIDQQSVKMKRLGAKAFLETSPI
jgi:2-polyprenyl-6-methoxyphenol hydroxylase-like FAD-dependent oxidoreductase